MSDLVLPNGSDLGAIPPAPNRDHTARLVIVSLFANAGEALEMLRMLGLAPPAKAKRRRRPRRNWPPGSYAWKTLPNSRVLHAVKPGIRCAACSSRPKGGSEWLEPGNTTRRCPTCVERLTPEAADARALPRPCRAVAVRGGPRAPRRGPARLRRRRSRALARAPRRA